MLNKKINKQSILLLTCLLSLPNTISFASPPSYFDSAQKYLSFALTVSSLYLITYRIRTLPRSYNTINYYQDWTNPSQSSNELSLTTEQEKFLTNLLSNMGSDENPHAVITGEAGSGKTTIVRALAKKITNKDKILENTQFKNAIVWSVDADILNSGKTTGSLGARFKQVWYAASNCHKTTGKKVILFFDEFHRLVSLGNHSTSSTSNLGELLKTLTGNKADYCGVHIIGATTTDEYRTFVSPNKAQSAFARRFPAHTLPPISDKDALSILKRERWHCQKKDSIFIPKTEIEKVSQACLQRSKKYESSHHPNPDKLKKIFEKMIVEFVKEKHHEKDLKEITLYEEINFLNKRIRELTPTQDEKIPAQREKTWTNWLTNCLWTPAKTKPETSSSAVKDINFENKTVNYIRTIFHQKESTKEERKALRDALWKLKADFKESDLSNTKKNSLQKELKQALQIALKDRENTLKEIKTTKVKLKAILTGHARLAAERQRLIQQDKNGNLVCTSQLITEKNIEPAIHKLTKLMQRQERKLLNFSDKNQLTSVMLHYNHAHQLLEQLPYPERHSSQALSMYT